MWSIASAIFALWLALPAIARDETPPASAGATPAPMPSRAAMPRGGASAMAVEAAVEAVAPAAPMPAAGAVAGAAAAAESASEAARPGLARRALSACGTAWTNFYNRREIRAREYFERTDRSIGDYLPTTVEPRTVDGVIVRYSEEQLKSLREGVDTYFSWRGRTDSEIADFRDWLKKLNGENYLPLSEENVQAWRERGWTLRQVLDFLYDNFQRRTYINDAIAAAEASEPANRNLLRRATVATGRQISNIAKGLANTFLTQWKFTLGGIAAVGVVNLGLERYFGLQFTVDRIQNEIRTRSQDREGVLRELNAYMENMGSERNRTYFNDESSLTAWMQADERRRALLISLSREIVKLEPPAPPPPAPQPVRPELNVAVSPYQGLAESLMDRYRRDEATFRGVERELSEHRRRFPNLDNSTSLSEADRAEVRKREELAQRFMTVERELRTIRNDMAMNLAQWRLTNTQQIAMVEGRQRARPTGSPSTDAEQRAMHFLETERRQITRYLRDLLPLGLFNDFAVAHQTSRELAVQTLQNRFGRPNP